MVCCNTSVQRYLFVLLLAVFGQFHCRSIESIVTNVIAGSGYQLLVLPINALGLANRLRIMSSAYSIAVSRKATLVVIWCQSDDCNSSFDDLFTIDGVVHVLSMPPEDSIQGVFENLIRAAVHNVASAKNYASKEHHLRDFLVNTDTLSADINILWTRGTHAPHSMGCGDYMHAKSLFYEHLAPSGAVGQLIEGVSAQMKSTGGIVVGVHVRAFDIQFDWAVVSPSLAADGATRTAWSSQVPDVDGQGAHVLLGLQSKRFDEAF